MSRRDAPYRVGTAPHLQAALEKRRVVQVPALGAHFWARFWPIELRAGRRRAPHHRHLVVSFPSRGTRCPGGPREATRVQVARCEVSKRSRPGSTHSVVEGLMLEASGASASGGGWRAEPSCSRTPPGVCFNRCHARAETSRCGMGFGRRPSVGLNNAGAARACTRREFRRHSGRRRRHHGRRCSSPWARQPSREVARISASSDGMAGDGGQRQRGHRLRSGWWPCDAGPVA